MATVPGGIIYVHVFKNELYNAVKPLRIVAVPRIMSITFPSRVKPVICAPEPPARQTTTQVYHEAEADFENVSIKLRSEA